MDETGIYEPEEDSFLLEAEVKKYARGRVLDMGTGSGIQATAAASMHSVREVIAVDINKDAVRQLNEKNIVKIKANKSDLFQSVKGKFDTIIFNPPYLPDDLNDNDLALDGGVNGHELIERFLAEAPPHLEKHGFILLLYSSRSGDVAGVISRRGYMSELLSKKALPFFEELFVVRLELANPIMPHAVGKRGVIFVEGKICIKEKKPESEKDSLANEAEFLEALNKHGIGPKFISFDGKALRREFIEGVPLGEFIAASSAGEIRSVFIDVLNQCRKMDKLSINKTELTKPYKDILVTSENKAVLIDFERCRKTQKPQNVTQFLQYIMSQKKILSRKGINILDDWIMLKGKKYKDFLDDKTFFEIVELISEA